MWGFPRGFPNVIKLLSILNAHKGFYLRDTGGVGRSVAAAANTLHSAAVHFMRQTDRHTD